MSPSEQMYFHGAPLAHVVLYYEARQRKRIERRCKEASAHERRSGARAFAPERMLALALADGLSAKANG
jgi:hypothetical protein